MLCAADVDAANVELARIGFGIGQQIGQGGKFGILVDHDGNVERSQNRQWDQIFFGIVGQGFKQVGTDRRGIGHEQQGVTIGRRLGNCIGGHHTARSGLVFNHDALP